jgi:Grap2 and cyclin-D-interacting
LLYACERYVQCLSNSAAAPTRTLLHSECMCTCHTCCATGMVWAGVAAVSKAPSDNKACLFKCLAAVIGVMKDALREVSLGLLMEPHEPPPPSHSCTARHTLAQHASAVHRHHHMPGQLLLPTSGRHRGIASWQHKQESALPLPPPGPLQCAPVHAPLHTYTMACVTNTCR